MRTARSLSPSLAGAVALALGLWTTAAGQADPPRPRSGSLPSYVDGWQAPADGVLDFTFDARNRIWLLTRAGFVRLDEQGKIAERLPFAWPADLRESDLRGHGFLVSGDDFVVGRYRFDRAGQVVALYPFRDSAALAAGPDGSVIRLSNGLEIYDRKGKLVRRFSEGGLAPGKLETPLGLAVDRRGRIVVAELRRLQLFSPQGKLLRAVGLPADLLPNGIVGLAMDGDGYLYSPAALGSSTVAVFDPELRYLGSVKLPWDAHAQSLTADGRGRLYSFASRPSRLLRQAVPAAGSVRLAAPLPATGGELPRELPQVRPAREVPLAISVQDEPVLPYRLHASTRRVVEVATDPLVPGRLWLATEGGLVRYDSGSGQWNRWTLVDGLPQQWVKSVSSDGRRVAVLMENSAAVFDPGQGRFRSLRGLGENRWPFAGGVRVAAAPEAPGVLWWIVGQGVLRQDLAGGSWTSFPYPGPMAALDGLVLRGGRIAVLTPDALWELRPDAKEWRRVCDIDALDRASPTRRYSNTKLSLRSVSTDDEGRTFWLASHGNGLFRVEADSGKVAWPEETRDGNCGWQRVVRYGDRLFALGDRCLHEIGRPGSLALDASRVEEIRHAIPAPGQPEALWLATQRGLASLRLADGRLDFHLPSWSEPDGVRVATLLTAEGRLWVSQRDGGVSTLDPATGLWTAFPRLRPNQLIRRSAANGRLLIYSYGSRGRTLTWIDPKTAEEVLVPGRWDNDPWGAVEDVHHDAQGLWAMGRLRSGKGQGFGVQRSDGTSQILLSGELSTNPNSLLPDPEHPGDFLLLGKEGELLRVHTGTGETETLRTKVDAIRPAAGGRYVWLQGEPSARLDLRTGSMATLDLEGRSFPDPGDPDRVWLLRPGRLTLYDVTRRERLEEIELPSDLIGDELAIQGGSLWIGSWAGLLEVPQP